jgi:PAS domain S-box-containing protein
VGPYQILQVAAAGGLAFGAISCGILWLRSRERYILLCVALACVVCGLQASALALLGGARTEGGAQVLLQLRGVGGALLAALAAWVLAALSGFQPRRYLWTVTVVLSATSVVLASGVPLLGEVTRVDRVVMPWGEVLSIPARQPSSLLAAPAYLAALSVPAFGVLAAWHLRTRDLAGAVLISVTSVLLMSAVVLALAIDFIGLRLPYIGSVAQVAAVLVLAVQMGQQGRRQAVRLAATEGRFRAIFDQTYEWIGLLAADGTLLEANRAALEIVGARQADVIGRPFWDGPWWTHAPELQARLRDAIAAARRGEVVRFETTHPTRDGRRLSADFSLKAVREADGSAGLLIAEGCDITARRQAENALRQSEAWYRFLLQSQAGFVVSCQPDGTLTFVNDSFGRFVGASPEALAGTSLLAPVVPEHRERMAAVLAEPGEAGPAPRLEVEMRTGDGAVRWTEWTVSELSDDAGQGVGREVTGADVHDRVTAERSRRQLDQHLARSRKLEALGHLAGGVAHDFNNLLTVIEGHTQMLQAEVTDPGHRHEIAEIQAAGARAAHMTRELLAFSRRSALRVTVVDADAVVRRTEAVLARTIGADVAIDVRLGPGGHAVEADADQLGRVLLNLAMNARDAMPRGGRLTIETRDLVLGDDRDDDRGLASGSYVAIVVRDTGTGIAPDVRPRIFEPFFTSKGAEGRTGMGLAVAEGIITQFGGAIDVESLPDRGTAVTILLPRATHGATAAGA